jgi:uncharacterized integral membrane protein
VAFGFLLMALVAGAVAVFTIQNSVPTRVQFLIWVVDGMPLSAVVLAALAAGLLVMGVPLWIGRWRLRSHNRALRNRIQSLENTLARREETPPSTSPGP